MCLGGYKSVLCMYKRSYIYEIYTLFHLLDAWFAYNMATYYYYRNAQLIIPNLWKLRDLLTNVRPLLENLFNDYWLIYYTNSQWFVLFVLYSFFWTYLFTQKLLGWQWSNYEFCTVYNLKYVRYIINRAQIIF